MRYLLMLWLIALGSCAAAAPQTKNADELKVIALIQQMTIDSAHQEQNQWGQTRLI